MKAMMKEWTKEEKERMIMVSKEIMDVLEKLKSPIMMANVTNILNENVKEMYGLEQVLIASKEKKIIDHKDAKNILNIFYGMATSDINLVIFRDEPIVWMQYYLGIHLGKRTYIIIREDDATENTIIRLQGKIIKVKEFNSEEIDKIVKQIGEEVKNV